MDSKIILFEASCRYDSINGLTEVKTNGTNPATPNVSFSGRYGKVLEIWSRMTMFSISNSSFIFLPNNYEVPIRLTLDGNELNPYDTANNPYLRVGNHSGKLDLRDLNLVMNGVNFDSVCTGQWQGLSLGSSTNYRIFAEIFIKAEYANNSLG